MSEWISVTEKVPERLKTVLVYATDEWGDRVTTFGALGISCIWFELHSGDDVEVTHWQPMPEPPEDAK